MTTTRRRAARERPTARCTSTSRLNKNRWRVGRQIADVGSARHSSEGCPEWHRTTQRRRVLVGRFRRPRGSVHSSAKHCEKSLMSTCSLPPGFLLFAALTWMTNAPEQVEAHTPNDDTQNRITVVAHTPNGDNITFKLQ